jgi:hypothetical protein
MPTVLQSHGWRLFFHSNAGEQAPTVQAARDGVECRFRLLTASFDLEEEWSYHLAPQFRRQIRQIIFEHFDEIAAAWDKTFEGGADAYE